MALEEDRVVEVGRIAPFRSGDREVEVEGSVLLPGFVNAHDVLDASTFPPTGLSSTSPTREGRPRFGNLYDWLEASPGTTAGSPPPWRWPCPTASFSAACATSWRA